MGWSDAGNGGVIAREAFVPTAAIRSPCRAQKERKRVRIAARHKGARNDKQGERHFIPQNSVKIEKIATGCRVLQGVAFQNFFNLGGNIGRFCVRVVEGSAFS